jgi:hypothetical protein
MICGPPLMKEVEIVAEIQEEEAVIKTVVLLKKMEVGTKESTKKMIHHKMKQQKKDKTQKILSRIKQLVACHMPIWEWLHHLLQSHRRLLNL